MTTGGLAVLAALAAQSGWAGDAMPRFGWGAPLARTQETLGGLVSAPRPCARGWRTPAPGCRALVVERHRLGRYIYRLELQHGAENGLQRIVVTSAAPDVPMREAATAYAILVFDAAFAESHGRLAGSPAFRHVAPGPERSPTGYEWLAQYGPPDSRVRLHARVAGPGQDGGGLMIER
ncbi:MAG: hypothetical protein IT512_00330 [Rhodocyclaceae bacterium]|nr:hypothetical protein [Rhodocyclaceae bacterium]